MNLVWNYRNSCFYLFWFLNKGSKRKRKEPTHLKNYCVTTCTGAEDEAGTSVDNSSDPQAYWCRTIYYPIIDAIITQLKIRFSEESLKMGKAVDSFLKLDFEGSSFFINHYKVRNLYVKCIPKSLDHICNSLFKLIKYC